MVSEVKSAGAPQPGRLGGRPRLLIGSASAQVELAGPYPSGECLPLIGAEHQLRAVRVLGVTDGDDTRQVVGDLHAAPAVASAVAALAPLRAVYSVHRSSDIFPIRSREAPRGSASALNVPKVSESFPTTDGLPVVCPWSGDSMYTVPGALSTPAMAKPPSRPACAPTPAGTI